MTPEARHDWKIEKLERRLEAHPDDGEALLDLAESSFQKGYYYSGGDTWYLRSHELAEHYLTHWEDGSRARNILAAACFSLGRHEEAEGHYRRSLLLDPGDALALVGLGNLHRARGEREKAIASLKKAIEIDPNLWQAHHNLGDDLLGEARDRDFQKASEWMEAAIYHLVTALRLGPPAPFLPGLYRDLGELFLHTRQYPHARRFFSKLTTHPEHGPEAWYYLGLIHFSMGKFKNALQHYRTYLKHVPDNALALSKIGLCHLELQEYDRARAACEDALRLQPGNLLARFTLGCVASASSDIPTALRLFSGLLEEDPHYFPAYVELVKTRHRSGDLPWLVAQLRAEVAAFEASPGPDGGRFFYQGARGGARRRVDVLLAQLEEWGEEAFPHLSEIAEGVQSDSLKFQIWEELLDLSRAVRTRQVIGHLQNPTEWFGRDLGREALLLSQHIPTEILLQAFAVDGEAVRRAALQRKERGDDIHAYMQALDQTQREMKQFRAWLLLSLAFKTEALVEDFLTDHLEGEDEFLSRAAAIALVFHGSDRAETWLVAQAETLPKAEKQKILALLQVARHRRDDEGKVIELEGRERRSIRSASSGGSSVSCSLCGRGATQVDRLMSGNRVLICNLCISQIHAHRQELRVPDHEDSGCGFCQKSVFEVENLYRARGLLICSLCLDTCVSLLQREEIERFLLENF